MVDRRARHATGKPALLGVELATGRRFDGRLSGGAGEDERAAHPPEFLGFVPAGGDSGTTMYVRLAAISTISVLAASPDREAAGEAAGDVPS